MGLCRLAQSRNASKFETHFQWVPGLRNDITKPGTPLSIFLQDLAGRQASRVKIIKDLAYQPVLNVHLNVYI